MSGSRRAVWVTRPVEGGRETARALRVAGFAVIEAPVLEIGVTAPVPLPAGPGPDWIILVSANAARGLVAARELTALRRPTGRPTRIAAVGRRTAEQAAALGLTVDLVPEKEDAEGLAAALAAEDLAGSRVWIPAGNRPGSATRGLPRSLAGAGAVAEVFQVYETRARALAAPELEQLAAAPPGAVVLHSPSAAEAVFDSRQPEAVRRWREAAVLLAIGPTTRAWLAELDAHTIHECAEPSDAGVLSALADIPSLRDSRSST